MRLAPAILILSTIFCSYAGEAFRNFASCISIQDFEIIGDTVWVASTGGIYKHCRSTGKGILLPNVSTLPDPFQTAFFYDSDKNLWSGTVTGFLSKRNSSGKITVSSSYVSANWPITDLTGFGKYIVVGSSKGVGFFDKKAMNAVKSAVKFNALSTSIVNALYIQDKTLYVGLDQGFARLDLSNNLDSINLFDPNFWKVDTTGVRPVRSFLNFKNSIMQFKGPSAVFKGKILHSDSCILFADNKEVYRFPSVITAIKSNGDECWIGTKENYFYRWNGVNSINYSIPGMTSSIINRVYVDHASNLWVIPRVNGFENPWWRGILSLQNEVWKLYNLHNYPDIGFLGEDPNFIGIAESHHKGEDKTEWRMWFGTSGAGIKCFIPGLDDWSIYSLSLQNDRNANLIHSKQYYIWTKSDAIVQDSSGYMWMSNWNVPQSPLVHNALICYDPRYEPDPQQRDPEKAHYRNFFRAGDAYHSDNYTAMSLDANGNIIAGSETGKVIVFKPAKNPLRDTVTLYYNFTIGLNEFGEFEPLGNVLDIASTPDGSFRVVAGNGVYKFISEKKILEKENLGTGVKAIEAEDASVLWLGISNEGLVRYDVNKDERTVFGVAQGLISTDINDLALDKKNGLVWVATYNGISRFSIGYKLEQNKESTVLVYPNPFCKRRHTMIYFKNLPTDSKVEIYSVDGQRISSAKLARQSSDGAYYTWTPETKTAPGTYFYSVHGNDIKKTGKFLITP